MWAKFKYIKLLNSAVLEISVSAFEETSSSVIALQPLSWEMSVSLLLAKERYLRPVRLLIFPSCSILLALASIHVSALSVDSGAKVVMEFVEISSFASAVLPLRASRLVSALYSKFASCRFAIAEIALISRIALLLKSKVVMFTAFLSGAILVIPQSAKVRTFSRGRVEIASRASWDTETFFMVKVSILASEEINDRSPLPF